MSGATKEELHQSLCNVVGSLIPQNHELHKPIFLIKGSLRYFNIEMKSG
jgi:hypothetical protein